MWVRSGISKRRKRREGGRGRKGEMVVISSPTEKGRGLLLFVGMLRGISPWNSIGGSKWHRACRYYSHDPSFLSVFFQSIVSPSFHYLFSPFFSFFFPPPFKFYYSHFIQLIDRLFLSFKLNQA